MADEAREPSISSPSALCLLSWRKLLTIVPLAKMSIYKAMKTGDFPKPVRLGESKVAWRSDEVEEWIRTRPRVEMSARLKADRMRGTLRSVESRAEKKQPKQATLRAAATHERIRRTRRAS